MQGRGFEDMQIVYQRPGVRGRRMKWLQYYKLQRSLARLVRDVSDQGMVFLRIGMADWHFDGHGY